ncbi:MAG TPA: RNA polymerase sigma factor [Polyangia bacterium]|nr:RNA polymerase sigma factor [Polyangia bacterium]
MARGSLFLVPVPKGGEAAEAAARTAVHRTRLERMFTAHHILVWRTLRRRGLDPETAADATQQTFLIAAERLDDIASGSERAFLIGTALRVGYAIGRKVLRWQLEDDMDQHVANARDLSDAQSAIELCDLVLSKVDPALAEVFVLFELDGFSSIEIAKLLEIPVGTVASRLRRAREQFRAVAGRIDLALQREGQEGNG